MDSTRRILAKSVTWQLTGLVTMSLLGYALTGDWALGGQFALSSAALGLAMFALHEKLWARIGWGRAEPQDHAPR